MDVLHNLDWVLPLRSPALTWLAFGLSWLGSSTFIMFFVVVGYWAWDKSLFFRLMLLIAFSGLLNGYLKDFFQDPRPPLALRMDDLVADSYGLPSGHAQLAVVIWMWLAYELRRRWIWLLLSLVTLGVIASRLYLGAHDLEDVLAGAGFGAATLFAIAACRQRAWWRALPPLAAPLALLLLFGAAVATWPNGRAIPKYVPLMAGWVLAALAGARAELRMLRFGAAPDWQRNAAAVALGALVFAAIQQGLQRGGLALGLPLLPLEAVKGLVLGFCVTLPIPWLLARLRLMPIGVRPSYAGGFQ